MIDYWFPPEESIGISIQRRDGNRGGNYWTIERRGG